MPNPSVFYLKCHAITVATNINKYAYVLFDIICEFYTFRIILALKFCPAIQFNNIAPEILQYLAILLTSKSTCSVVEAGVCSI